jgi:dodecin
MTVIKVVELLANSKKSWEDATAQAIKRASKSINNIRSANVGNMSVTVKNGKVAEYRVSLKVTFEVGG